MRSNINKIDDNTCSWAVAIAIAVAASASASATASASLVTYPYMNISVEILTDDWREASSDQNKI